MSVHLLDSVKDLFSNDVISKARSSLGETEGGVQKALTTIIPSVLTGMLVKAGSGDADGLLALAGKAAGGGVPGELPDGGSAAGDGSDMLSQAGDMLKGLLGDKVHNVVNMVSGFSGVKESSAASLLNMAAPAALGVLGRKASENNMDAGGLSAYLNTQKDHILGSIPLGFNLSGALGLSNLANIGSKLSGTFADVSEGAKSLAGGTSAMANRAADTAKGGSKWLVPLLLIIAAIALIWYFMKGCNIN